MITQYFAAGQNCQPGDGEYCSLGRGPLWSFLEPGGERSGAQSPGPCHLLDTLERGFGQNVGRRAGRCVLEAKRMILKKRRDAFGAEGTGPGPNGTVEMLGRGTSLRLGSF